MGIVSVLAVSAVDACSASSDDPEPIGSSSEALVTVAVTSPASNATVRGTVNVTANASDGPGINRVEFRLDGVLRATDTTAPYSFRWDAFHDTFGTHANGVHQLSAMAFSNAGTNTTHSIPVKVVPAAAGDCNSDGVVNAADVTAIGSEINDGDGTAPESSAGGTFAGNPACDANEDNVISATDQTCANSIISTGNPAACLDQGSPLVLPLLFVPTDMQGQVTPTVEDFVKNKIQEGRRFYAMKNNGRTFRTLPMQKVIGNGTKASYWGTNPFEGSFEESMMIELQGRGFPVASFAQNMPANRIAWIVAMGAGGRAFSRFSNVTSGGWGLIGDAVLFAGIDLNCSRVVAGYPGDPVVSACQNFWFPGGEIYGFSIGALVHEVGHAFELFHPFPDTNPDWQISVMGTHWSYATQRSNPAWGLANADRATLATSRFFPAGAANDCGAPAWSSTKTYQNGNTVTSPCTYQHLGCSAGEMYKTFTWQCVASVPSWCSSFQPGSNQNYANIWNQVTECDTGSNKCSSAQWSSSANYQNGSVVRANCTYQHIACSASEMNLNYAWQCVASVPSWCSSFRPGSNQNYIGIWDQVEQCNGK